MPWINEQRLRQIIREELTNLLDERQQQRQVDPITDRQSRAYHAKVAHLADLLRATQADVRQQMMVLASRNFDRQIEHCNELTAHEASWVLDHLSEAIKREETNA